MKQRQIKFRAFDEQMNRMDYFGLGETVPYYYKDENSPATKYDVMQFTGLLDKNGKPIYEGDIVQNQASAKRDIRRTKYGEYKLFCGEHNNSFYKGWVEGTEWEIIGNIYENPELLK